MLSFLVDGLILILLGATLLAGLRLQRSLQGLRHGNQELQDLIAALDAASEQAKGALGGFKEALDASGLRLADETKGVQGLIDDLQFLVNRGSQAADQLEAQIRDARGLAPADRALKPMPRPIEPRPGETALPKADLEQALRALR